MSEPGPTMPSYIPEQHQLVTCPNCMITVPYASFCSNCGASLPPIWPPVIAAPPVPRRSRRLIIGIILAIILATSVAGVFGYTMYQNNQQSIQQAAKNSELLAANQAINQLSITCFSNRTDISTLTVTTNPPSGFVTLYEKFGVNNPSQYSMDATWTLTFNYPSASVILRSVQSFHLSAKSTSYPEFAFRITASDISSFHSIAGTTPQFIVSLDGAYSVTGSYSTYHVTQHQSYDSSTSSSAGGFGTGSSSTSARCP